MSEEQTYRFNCMLCGAGTDNESDVCDKCHPPYEETPHKTEASEGEIE